MTHVHPTVKWKYLTKSYSFWVKPCTLIFHFAFNFLWCGHFCSYKSWAALKQWFDLPCLSLPHKSLSVINIILSDCGVSNGIPCPKITPQKSLSVHVWKKLLGRKVRMTLASARNVRYRSSGHQEQDRPSRTQTTSVPDVYPCLSGEAHVWGSAQTTLSSLFYKEVHGAFLSFGVAAQASCAQMYTFPAAPRPSSLQARADVLGLSLASSHQ